MIMKYKRYDKKSKIRTIIFMMSAAICVFSAASFSVLAYEKPIVVLEPDTELSKTVDASFAMEEVDDAYLGVNIDTFKISDKIFIDENGNIYPIYVLFGELSAPRFFTLNAPVFRMVWINIQNS